MHVGSLGWEKNTNTKPKSWNKSCSPEKLHTKSHILELRKGQQEESISYQKIQETMSIAKLQSIVDRTVLLGRNKEDRALQKVTSAHERLRWVIDLQGFLRLRVFDSEWNLLHANTTRRDPGKQVSRWTSGSAMAVCHEILSYSRNSKKVNVHVAKYGRLETTRKYKK